VGISANNRLLWSLEQTLHKAHEETSRQELLTGLEVILVIRTVQVLSSILVIVGALNMLALRIHGLAMIVSVVVMLPGIAPCFGLGLVFGIWSVVRLSDEIVKDAFWL